MTRLTHGHQHGSHPTYEDEQQTRGLKLLVPLAWRNAHLRQSTDYTTGRPPVVKASVRQQWRDDVDLARVLASLYTFS